VLPVVSIDAHDRTPLYTQLDRAIRAAIAAGRLQAGEQLPTVRQLAVDLRVNANTVARVYADLERDDVLETRRGVGTFVRAGPAQARSADEHSRRLKALVTRMLGDAASAGFTLDEVAAELERHRR
jgi:GntR family transcriptional regulator